MLVIGKADKGGREGGGRSDEGLEGGKRKREKEREKAGYIYVFFWFCICGLVALYTLSKLVQDAFKPT